MRGADPRRERAYVLEREVRDRRVRVGQLAGKLAGDLHAEPREEVTLVDFDPEGEGKVAAAVLYASTGLPDDQLLELVRAMSPDERAWRAEGLKKIVTQRDPGDWIDDQLADIASKSAGAQPVS